MKLRTIVLGLTVLISIYSVASAQAQDATVNFGVAASGPLGPAPCLQEGNFGGPTDPCAYLLHHMNSDVDVTIGKGGQVRFNVAGGGHSIAIYEVHQGTTRSDIGEDLCAGFVRDATPSAAGQPCNQSAANAGSNHIVSDGKGDVILISGTNPPNGLFVDYEPGRLASHSATANGTFFTYRFLKTGRYLVICKTRPHLMNDWMFGFVDVVGE